MLIRRVLSACHTWHGLLPGKRGLQPVGQSSLTRLGWFRLASIDQYSSLLPPVRPQRIRGIRPRFRGLSPNQGQVAYVLLTSAPVAGGSIATSPLPLDLHVLSLSLAFILSQDQTLRC